MWASSGGPPPSSKKSRPPRGPKMAGRGLIWGMKSSWASKTGGNSRVRGGGRGGSAAPPPAAAFVPPPGLGYVAFDVERNDGGVLRVTSGGGQQSTAVDVT